MKTQLSTVKSADRVLDILELLADQPAGTAFSDLSAALQIPKSSLFPLLRNLVHRGYVVQAESGGVYQLGKQVQYLAAKLEAPPLLSLVAPFIEAAARELNETSAFYVRHGDQARVALAVNGSQTLRSTLTPGDEGPLYVLAAGRAILSVTRPDHRDAYLKFICPEAFTPNTKLDLSEVGQAVEESASSGFSYDYEEFSLGIICVARVVCYAGAPCGAVSFAIPSARFNEASRINICRVLRTTTAAIEVALSEAGYKV
ncbi:IclR family transcriptional regulator [Sphingobium sp.]|uniref:IclR family transcriptional regulator n=1 Tax=Sphingobium sp. TaxID=1912891 RepID=UPI0028BF10C4|nr:IclR family transcriptional regulator [Sphingobium sp.]